MDKCGGEFNHFEKLTFFGTSNFGQIKIDWKMNNINKAIKNVNNNYGYRKNRLYHLLPLLCSSLMCVIAL